MDLSLQTAFYCDTIKMSLKTKRMNYMNDLKHSFLSPADEFSPVPFWFLNDELDKAELKRQLEDFYSKGIRTVVLHPRKGLPLSAPYLSEKFLDYIEYITQLAEELKMNASLPA